MNFLYIIKLIVIFKKILIEFTKLNYKQDIFYILFPAIIEKKVGCHTVFSSGHLLSSNRVQRCLILVIG